MITINSEHEDQKEQKNRNKKNKIKYFKKKY